MMEDDIANNPVNPHPGQLFNCPGCGDVYKGVPKDYTGENVTAANMLSVLIGDADAVRGVGSGRVIASGAHDRVFVYYSDHGAPGTYPHQNPCISECDKHFRCVAWPNWCHKS
jgi:legumain